jgi:acyl transferase domain-containing protein/thioesterase domain-containing protein/acyl carrier protein
VADDNDIAIVGMAVHVPGAGNVERLWQNLRHGVESVVALTDEELLAAGVAREVLLRPSYVRAAAPLDDMEMFDAEFFGFSPKEAAILDPQHRHFLTCAWEALEDAGHPPEAFDGSIGVFAGCGMGSYFAFNLLTNPELVRNVGLFLLRHTGNDKDFLATRASYLFDLRGPAVNVQTACSTSLVATHLACQHLLSFECDMALAGGVTIEIPHRRGYHYEPGEILSPDGHCRAFDHRAEGTVFGSGAGVVVLRRLQDALDDGDHVYAVIKATAVNNDGSQKVGYLAPSVDGQAACVAEALSVAGVSADTIGYVECHGTGTAMGDPIEVAALTQAFRETTDAVGFCGIGSIKTNIGHLDTAAGVASLVKASLAVERGERPPSLNFEAGNPLIDFGANPFFVQDRLEEWKTDGGPRRAGVNSLGVGGTNAFAIVEEPPLLETQPSRRPWQLLVVSARTRTALDQATTRLAEHLAAHPELDLGDVAWTLQTGRRAFAERRVVVTRDRSEAVELLNGPDARRVFSHRASNDPKQVAFMFPGGGAQYPRMAFDLYRDEPVFAAHVDAGLALLEARHGLDLRPLLLADDGELVEAGRRLEAPSVQLPAIFVVEHALAQLLMSWGITPSALVGHSVGENTAACVAGTMSFKDCLGLVVLRGRLMDEVAGGMLAVALDPDELHPLLDEEGLDLAAVNAPELCVASGSREALDRLAVRLEAAGVEAQRVRIDIAAHSRLLEPVLAEFGAYLRSIELREPTIPWVSNTSGTWITSAEATDPDYWVRHLRSTVRFADCTAVLAEDPGRLYLEVGPGKALSSMVRMHRAVKASQAALPTLRHADEQVDDSAFLLTTLGRIWAVGGTLDTARLFEGEQRRRVSLPTYPFQSQRYFIEPGQQPSAAELASTPLVDRVDDEDAWCWEPAWRPREVEDATVEAMTWLVILDDVGVGAKVVERLRAAGHHVVTATSGDTFQRLSDDRYVLAPEQGREMYDELVRDLVRSGQVPDRIAHLALVSGSEQFRPGSSFFHRNQELGFYSVLFLAQAWQAEGISRPLHMVVTTCGAQRVGPRDQVPWPEQATVLGPVKVIPREMAGVTVSSVDLDPADLTPRRRARVVVADVLGKARDRLLDGGPERAATLVDLLDAELRAPASNDAVAFRSGRRFLQRLRRVRLDPVDELPLRQGGVVLVTGGLGGIGLEVAAHLHRVRGARLALLGRDGLPERAMWDDLVRDLGPDHPTAQRISRVRELEAAGAEVLVVDGDVTDVARMTEVVAEVQARFGGLHGVVHAAGTVDDAPLGAKSQSEVDAVLAPKVYGTMVLDQLLAPDTLELFVVFSSTSTVIAPVGQVDYVAANAFLNAYAQARRGVLALGWGVWSDTGMAARAARGMGGPAAAPEQVPCQHPFFDHRTTDAKGVSTFSATWSATSCWFLDDHRTADGLALLPGAGYPELARAALAELGIERPFTIRDLVLLRPLAVADDAPREVVVRLTPTAEGYSLVVRARVTIGAAGTGGSPDVELAGWQTTAQAMLALHDLATPAPLDLEATEHRCLRRAPTRTHQQDHLRFGPRWDVVERVVTGDDSAVARLRVPDRHVEDLDAVGLHPGLVDLGTGFAMDLIAGYRGDRLWVPVGYQEVRVHDRLPQAVVAVATASTTSSEESGFATFDATLAAADGRVLVEVEGFTIKRLDGPLDIDLGRADDALDVELDPFPVGERALSPPELAFQHNVARGIRPAEGVRLFERALRSRVGPVVYVSSMDLPTLVEQAEAAAAAQRHPAGATLGASFARPELASEFLAPRDDIEATLVEMWQELLGIDEVGVRDSFFDLGGHSLIAVRLFAQVKRTFSVEFPISVLFEAPTVEACAELVRAARPAGASGTATARETAIQPRYRYLVAMHPGEGGPRRPFFMVAGMFGNVLNLRHLAHQVGTDRPFYGVQARGLFGDDQPHETFEEMARDYLVEVRTVQPHGPYLLGGFSGGGIAALEMARQLHADGEQVALLVLLDTPLPTDERLTTSEKAQMHAQNLRRMGWRYPADWLRTRAEWERRRWRSRRGEVTQVDQGALHSTEIEAAFYRALSRYAVRPHRGQITLFRPPLRPAHVFASGRQIDVVRNFLHDDNGWTPYCDELVVEVVPGDHDSMVLEPNVRVLAGHLRDAISEADPP